MVRIKPSFDGSDDSKFSDDGPSGFYDGPPPTPGLYQGVVKKMGLAKIGSGQNQGEDRISLLLEITEGKYKGAGIWHSLNLTTQGRRFVNQFLEALTDGSTKQREGIRKMFWQSGYDVEKESSGKMGQQFITIGSKFKPIGRKVSFMVKADSYNDEPRAAINYFVIPREDTNEEDVLSEEDRLEGINEFAPSETVSVGYDSEDPWS